MTLDVRRQQFIQASNPLVRREVALAMIDAGAKGLRLLFELAVDPGVAPDIRVSALLEIRHKIPRPQQIHLAGALLSSEDVVLQFFGITLSAQAVLFECSEQVQRLSSSQSEFWDLDELISIGAIARRATELLRRGLADPQFPD